MTRTTAAPLRGQSPPPEVVELCRALVTSLDALTDRLVAAIVEEEPSYGTGAGTPRADLWRSCHDNLLRVLTVLSGDVVVEDPLDAPRATGSRRAEQGVPLESVLHAYRLGFRTLWEGLVVEARDGAVLELLIETATTVWEIVDLFSSAVGDAYRATEAAIARRDDRHREALVDALLDGRGEDRAVVAEAAAALELPEHGRYLVVVLEGPDAAGPAAEALAGRGLRTAWRARAGRDVGLVAVELCAPADVCSALALVPGGRAGVSPVVEGLARVDLAHRLADTALRTLAPGHAGVAELDGGLPAALLVSSPDLADRLVHRALGGVLALDLDERTVLLETLAAWLDTGGSAGQTAARLTCHRNTVLNRLRRLEGLTGRSLERVDDLVEWSLALLALRLLPGGR